MRAALLTLGMSALVLLNGAEARETFLTREQALRVAFPKAESIEKRLVLPTVEQRGALEKEFGAANVPRVFTYWIGRSGKHVDGYAVIEDVLGKSEPITYMLVVEPSLRVRSVEILAYRESRGGEVRQEGWREQFTGKDPTSVLKVGSDVRNIAGATISCRAITDGVRHELALLAALAGREADKPLAATETPQDARPTASGAGVERMQFLMGTTLRVQIQGVSDEIARAASDAVFAEVARLEDELSTWRPESAASRLNQAASGAWVPIPADLGAVLAASACTSRLTNGAFDVTVGPAVELWRRCSAQGTWPGESEIAGVRASIGYARLELEAGRSRARWNTAGARIDLGGIGKGYALDRARAVLEHAGVHSALLDFGGQFLALDAPPGAKSWSVALRDPAHPDQVLALLQLANASISSTADYERGLEVAGRRVSHVVDPATALPVEGMLGASVVCASATDADALSTALFVLGAERGLALANSRGLAALVVDTAGRVASTPAFETRRSPAAELR